MPILPTHIITNIFNFAMANLFCFVVFEPKEIFDYFKVMDKFDCLLGRCGDRLLVVCY